MQHTSIAVRAFRWAAWAALLSLGSEWGLAHAIQTHPGSDPPAASSEIVSTPDLIAQGREFYGQSCSQCHGDDATGDEGPNLHDLSLSNARIAATIKKGIKGEMPTFAKKYDDRQIAVLVAFVRSLH